MLLPLLAALSLPCTQEPDPFQRFELPGGARLLVLEVPDAPRQSLFAFLPVGLLQDGAGRAQFAHLLEHALIRGAVSEGLQSQGLQFNGETTASTLRLEVFAEPEHWKDGVSLLARFLAVRGIDPAVLAREKASIMSELAATVPAGFTHKWAQAAWSQAVLHGRSFAAVRGDVAGAEPDQVAAYCAEHASLGAGGFLLAVGPVPAKEVEAFVREALPAPLEVPPSPAQALRADPAAFGAKQAHWDLDAHHYLEWYVLPAETDAQRAGAWLLAQRCGMDLMTSKEAALAGGKALAALHSLDAKRLLLLVQVPLGAEVPVESVQAALQQAFERGWKAKTLERGARQAARELVHLPAFSAVRAQLGSSPGAAFVEAQHAIHLFQIEAASGLPLPALARACATIEGTALAKAARQLLSAERRSSLVLRPQE